MACRSAPGPCDVIVAGFCLVAPQRGRMLWRATTRGKEVLGERSQSFYVAETPLHAVQYLSWARPDALIATYRIRSQDSVLDISDLEPHEALEVLEEESGTGFTEDYSHPWQALENEPRMLAALAEVYDWVKFSDVEPIGAIAYRYLAREPRMPSTVVGWRLPINRRDLRDMVSEYPEPEETEEALVLIEATPKELLPALYDAIADNIEYEIVPDMGDVRQLDNSAPGRLANALEGISE